MVPKLPEDIYSKLKKVLDSPFRVVILTHINPDGDAIGSMLGLYWFLKRRGCTVNMAVPNAFPQFLAWMEGAEQILDFAGQSQQVEEELQRADLVFCVDFNEPDRLGGIRDILLQEYNVDQKRCERELLALLDKMAERKIIEVTVEDTA